MWIYDVSVAFIGFVFGTAKSEVILQQFFNRVNPCGVNWSCGKMKLIRNLGLCCWYCLHLTLNRIGLIEWMENTCTLKEFLYSTMTKEEQQRTARYYTHAFQLMAFQKNFQWSLNFMVMVVNCETLPHLQILIFFSKVFRCIQSMALNFCSKQGCFWCAIVWSGL